MDHCFSLHLFNCFGLPWWLSGKESVYQCKRLRFDPWIERIPREGNGNPVQYSYLGNPTDRGAWWAKSPWDHKRVRCNLATKQQQQQCIYLFSSLLGFHCCAQAFSSCSEPGLFSGSNAQTSMPWLLLLGLMDRFSSSDTGLSYPIACEIFQTRDRTHVPWIGRQIPNHQGSPIVSVLFLWSHILY